MFIMVHDLLVRAIYVGLLKLGWVAGVAGMITGDCGSFPKIPGVKRTSKITALMTGIALAIIGPHYSRETNKTALFTGD